ncbi:GNAT family N-acetyltransferase [Staphylococcus sp. SQ8-PEA]|uniref:GNAT family N-acetyltransferase n=1 Tax=Staphylococcus marylandisciuri TaxID=2981529 RepID=A0ABT2QPW5_9STAP|nr:GNAT family N-acetyltransferase [Staphylococcus marylandisciuri]MCU5746020.1 GNAT family N-acetyltransferase [Staphylococcus marylandisciuri]
MIRKAREKDRDEVAKLIYLIWQGLDTPMVREIEKERLLRIIQLSMSEVKYRSHIDHTWVCELEGRVAGFLIAYPGQYEMQLEHAWLDLDLDEDIKAYGLPMPTKEARDDEYYIESIATFPEFRGRGVATHLIQAIIQAHPYEKISLNCDKSNDKALRLYKKLGFLIDSEIDLYHHDHYHMIYESDRKDS